MIRAATIADLDAVTDLGMRFVSDPHYAQFMKADRDQLRDYMAAVISGPHSAVLMAEAHTLLIGMAGVQVQPHQMSGETVAHELFWYVRQGYRDGTGRQIMKAAEAWARDRNAVKLQMTAPDDRVAKLYTRAGFQRVETTYQKELT